MRKTDFGKNWEVRRLNSAESAVPVTLPHDAMLSEERAEENPGIHNIGYFAGYDYEYTKTFHLDEDRKGETIFLLFEAIYHNSRIQVNGYEVPSRSYGYTQIVVDATPYLVFGGDNTVSTGQGSGRSPLIRRRRAQGFTCRQRHRARVRSCSLCWTPTGRKEPP